MVFYNPIDKFYKNIVGAVKDTDKVKFRVKGNFGSVILRVKKDGEDFYVDYKMSKNGTFFEVELSFLVGLYFYHFLCDDCYIGLGGDYLGVITNYPRDFQLTSYLSDYSVPTSVYGGIIYQIFPDRFFKAEGDCFLGNNKFLHKNWNEMPNFLPNEMGKVLNNDFFGGNLKGIIEKLPYLKTLGVTIIYLNPIFMAYSNHRYDTGDYLKIDPMLGTEQDLIDLIKEAKNLGISLVLDGVFNHVGSDSVYFNKDANYDSLGAYQSKDSKYYEWFNFKNYPNEYESWWGIDTLPAINEQNEQYINFITGENGVIDKYTKLGVGGWRLDVVDELPDFFVEKIRDILKKNNKDGLLIGEVWEDATNKIAYSTRRKYFLGKELDSIMNYELKNAIINFVINSDSRALNWTVSELIDHYPKESLHALMNILSTHDTPRVISIINGINLNGISKKQMSEISLSDNEYQLAKKRCKIASLLQYTLPGIPSIYYGDEIGMQGLFDPYNRQTFKWEQIDIELYSWYSFLGELRQKFSCFSDGETSVLYASKGAFVFKRTSNDSEVLVAVNVGEDEIRFEFEGDLTDLITNNQISGNFVLKNDEFIVLSKF